MLVPLFATLASLAQALHASVLVPAVSIPVWNEYVGFIEWSLESLAGLFRSGGLAIIAFTIIAKTIVLPLTVKSIRSSKAMQELQPKIKELQKKHGKDRQRLTQETMALYQAHNANPMSGCLPMLIQIPIFLGLYQGIRNLSQSDTGYWHGGFLWLNSLAQPDPIFLLPVLAALFQFVQTQMMRPANQGPIEDSQQRLMNSMMNFMPLMVIVFGYSFASGAVLYWATQSVYSVVQQWFITGWGRLLDWFPKLPELPEQRRLGYRPPRPVEDVVVMSGENPVRQKGAMGWLQSRMADAQAQAEARRGGTSQTSAEAESAPPTAASAASAAAPARAAGRNGSGGSRNGARRKTGNGRVKAGTATGGAAAAANGAASANGQEGGSPATASRAVIVPRKVRPAVSDGGGEGVGTGGDSGQGRGRGRGNGSNGSDGKQSRG